MPTILARLKQRGEKIQEDSWPARKAREWIEAHKDPHFAEPINTEDRTAVDVVDFILQETVCAVMTMLGDCVSTLNLATCFSTLTRRIIAPALRLSSN